MGKRFELTPEWNIYSALESRDALLGWASEQNAKGGSDVLEISAAQVREVDGAGLQLLAALSNQEIVWKLVDASEVFMDACKTLGLGHWLESLPHTTGGA